MHTTFSDGTDSPEELVARVREAGIGLFSVTDHDSIRSASVIPGLLQEDDPVYISGAEFSCKDKEGKYHILGYNYDPSAKAIREFVENSSRLRKEKARARIHFLEERFGFVFPENEVDALLSLENPGKPHIAALLVKLEYAKDNKDAIENYIDKGNFDEFFVTPAAAIDCILKSGGIPVLAHPFFGSGSQKIKCKELDMRLRRLTCFGLKGIEAYYSKNTPARQRKTLSLAEEYGLFVTAGSDYHGGNKKVRLGYTGNPGAPTLEEMPDGFRQFLEEIKKAGRTG